MNIIHYITPLTKFFKKISNIFKDYTTVIAYDFAIEVEKGNLPNHETRKTICKGRKTFQPQQEVSLDISKFLNSY